MAIFDKRKDPNGEDESLNSFFGSDITMNGILDFRGTIRFDGKFEGEMISNGTLIVGDNGVLNAKIKAGYVVNSGKIIGDVQAAKSLFIYPNSQLQGNIETPDLKVYSGARFDGKCKMLEVVVPPASTPPIDYEYLSHDGTVAVEQLEEKESATKKPVHLVAAIATISILFLWLFFAKVDLGKFGNILGFYNPKQLVEQGLAFYDAGQDQEAFKKFKKASFMKFNDHALHMTLAHSFEDLTKSREALSEYKKAVKLHSDYREEFIRFLVRGNFDTDAVEQLKLFVVDNPENIKSHFELIGLYKKLEDEKSLYDEYAELIKLIPVNEEILKDMFRIEIANGWEDRAILSFDSLIKIGNRDPDIRLLYANFLFKHGREGKASGVFLALGRLLPGHIEAEINRGFSYINSSQLINADNAFSQVLNKDKDNLRAKYGRIMVLAKRRHLSDAIVEAEKLLQEHPQAAPILNRLAWLHYAKGDELEKGITLSEKALKIFPESPGYLDTLSNLQYKSGEKDKAVETMKKAVQFSSGIPYYKGKLDKYLLLK